MVISDPDSVDPEQGNSVRSGQHGIWVQIKDLIGLLQRIDSVDETAS
jgi:hypothetical protein